MKTSLKQIITPQDPLHTHTHTLTYSCATLFPSPFPTTWFRFSRPFKSVASEGNVTEPTEQNCCQANSTSPSLKALAGFLGHPSAVSEPSHRHVVKAPPSPSQDPCPLLAHSGQTEKWLLAKQNSLHCCSFQQLQDAQDSRPGTGWEHSSPSQKTEKLNHKTRRRTNYPAQELPTQLVPQHHWRPCEGVEGAHD